MKYYITEGDVNWADEIDFEGFDLFTEDELKDAKKSFSAGGEYYNKTVNACFGTNEDGEIEASDVLYELENATEITEAQYVAISDVLGDHYGVTSYGEVMDGADEIEEDYDISDLEDDDEYGAKIAKLSESDDQIQDEDPDGHAAPKLSESNWSECPHWDVVKNAFDVKDDMFTAWYIVDDIVNFNEDSYDLTREEAKEVIDFFVDKANTLYVINDTEGR